MRVVSNPTRLSPKLRKALEARIAAGGFTSVRTFTDWLRRHDLRIDRADAPGPAVPTTPEVAVMEDGVAQPLPAASMLERKLDAVRRATTQARAILAAASDDEAVVSDALIRLVQQIDFDILVQLEAGGAGEVNPRALAEIIRSVATLARQACSRSAGSRRPARSLRPKSRRLEIR